jgi:hypothetical protein
VLLSREAFAQIVPGQTTREQLLKITGGEPEESEQLHAPNRRTLSFRGRRVVPRRSRRLPWVATIQGWDVEQHELEIELDHDVVRDVQARVRRSHASDPTEA